MSLRGVESEQLVGNQDQEKSTTEEFEDRTYILQLWYECILQPRKIFTFQKCIKENSLSTENDRGRAESGNV